MKIILDKNSLSYFLLLIILLCPLFFAVSCLTKMAASVPVYPGIADGDPSVTLSITNQIHKNIIDDLCLFLTIDGFSPTELKCMPPKTTEIRLRPGSHEIQHTLKGHQRHFKTITTSFNLKEGKTYHISFKWYNKGINEAGYRILYIGDWDEEEKVRWPTKNFINLLW